nr:MAG TPA: hypothetical protein [Caudoviricetes sp.]DAY38103.1 MAG TPA: hypothetical protein [Caudoviricetes sp.]
MPEVVDLKAAGYIKSKTDHSSIHCALLYSFSVTESECTFTSALFVSLPPPNLAKKKGRDLSKHRDSITREPIPITVDKLQIYHASISYRWLNVVYWSNK